MKNKSPFSRSLMATPEIITAIFAAASILWILVTDHLLVMFVEDINSLTWYQTFKGWFFILLVSATLYFLLKIRFQKINQVSTELSESRSDYKLILDQASDAIFISDEYGRFIDANNQALNLCGFNLDELKKLSIKDLISKDDRENVPVRFQDIYSGKTLLQERQIITKDGNPVDVEMSIKILSNRKIQAIIRDISARKIIEKRLMESEKRYRLLFMDNPHPMWVYDVKTFRFLKVNNAAVEAYGYTYDEFYSMTLHEIRPGTEWDELSKNLRDNDARYQKSGPWKHKKKNGEIILVEIISSSTFYQNKEARIVLINDITNKIKAEDELKSSEERYRTLFEKSPVSIWEEDFSKLKAHIDLLKKIGVTDFRKYLDDHPEEVEKSVSLIKIVNVNEITLKIYEANSKDEILNGFDKVVDRESLHVIKETIIAIAENKKEFAVETSNTKMNGEKLNIYLKWVAPEEQNLTYKKVILTIIDISKLKEAEESLKVANENLLSTVNASALPIFVIDENHKVKFIWNKAATDLFGWSSEEITGKVFPSVKSNETQSFNSYVQKVLNGKTITGEQISLIKKSGEECIVNLSSAPLKDKNEKIIGAIMIAADITEKINAANEISKLNEEIEQRIYAKTGELEQVNKELEAFSYSVSHDLKAPLRAIEGFSKILNENYSGEFNPEVNKLVNAIRKNSMYMWEMIDDMLSLSRLNKTGLNKVNVDMNLLIDIAFNDLMQFEEKKMGLKIGELPEAKADRGLILQVWINLISNAIKFTSKTENPLIEIGGYKEEAENIYFIKDNGVGFEQNYASKLFSPFQRLHSEKDFEGTGIGLAIVKRIIIRHGGKVYAEAKPGEGAKFSFTIPVE